MLWTDAITIKSIEITFEYSPADEEYRPTWSIKCDYICTQYSVGIWLLLYCTN